MARRVLALILLGLALIVCVALAASESLTNRTGRTATAVTVTFSEQVRITSYDGTGFPTKTPTSRSGKFTFSGGQLENGAKFSISWTPSTAEITKVEWTQSAAESDCLARVSSPSVYGTSPSTPARVEEIAYRYLDSTRACSGTGIAVPIYLSVPFATPASDEFTVSVDGVGDALLTRVDEVDLAGEITVPAIPSQLGITVLRNGSPVSPHLALPVCNGFEAITLGVASLPGVSSCGPLPGSFIRAAAICDVWGNYIYGAPGEETTHTRDLFASTCDRLAAAGVTDVYITSFLEYTAVLPAPKLRLHPGSGAGAIAESDLRQLAEQAHARGLRLHLMYNAYTALDRSYFYAPRKPASWLLSLLEEYRAIVEEQADEAERCGVDGFVLNWQDGSVSYDGAEREWASGWKSIIQDVRARFSGHLEFNLALWEYVDDVIAGAVPASTFDGIDSFILSQWNPDFPSKADSIPVLYSGFVSLLERLKPLQTRVSQPVYLAVGLMSMDDYVMNGWRDAAIGLDVEDARPDFFEQARAYEALLLASQSVGAVGGIISGKYHWADPFGPDLGTPFIAQMDLTESVRNKPAEAVLKKWFGSPAPNVDRDLADGAQVRAAFSWCRVVPSLVSIASCSLLIDDFDGSVSLRDRGWRIDFDSAELHEPGSDPTSGCEITYARAASGDSYLKVSYRHDSWLYLRYAGFPTLDASAYAGIEATMWSETPLPAEVGVGGFDASGAWAGGRAPAVWATPTPSRFRIPFSAMTVDATPRGATPMCLEQLQNLGFAFRNGSGTLCIDDLCFYSGP